MPDDESRDAYRLGQVERSVRGLADQIEKMRKEFSERVDAVEAWKDGREEEDEEREKAAAKRERQRDRKVNLFANGVILLAVSILSGIAVAFFSGAHP